MGRTAIRADFFSLLNLPLIELVARANALREKLLGGGFDVCSIVNAKSGLCSQDCKFCAQSGRYPTKIFTYPLKDKKEILKAAQAARSIGAERFGIVTSGNRLTPRETNLLAQTISEIKTKVGIKICASLGALGKKQLVILKAAGLLRYHHNIETSADFYGSIVSTHSFKQRIDTIKLAKSLGLEICSGGIIGMGESWQDRIKMACLLKQLDVDCVPLNILIPIKNTPLESAQPVSCVDVVRTIGIFRIILENKTIKIVAGRETVFGDFQSLGFLAGANGMIVGGYLTTRGRKPRQDQKLVEEIKKLWKA